MEFKRFLAGALFVGLINSWLPCSGMQPVEPAVQDQEDINDDGGDDPFINPASTANRNCFARCQLRLQQLTRLATCASNFIIKGSGEAMGALKDYLSLIQKNQRAASIINQGMAIAVVAVFATQDHNLTVHGRDFMPEGLIGDSIADIADATLLQSFSPYKMLSFAALNLLSDMYTNREVGGRVMFFHVRIPLSWEALYVAYHGIATENGPTLASTAILLLIFLVQWGNLVQQNLTEYSDYSYNNDEQMHGEHANNYQAIITHVAKSCKEIITPAFSTRGLLIITPKALLLALNEPLQSGALYLADSVIRTMIVAMSIPVQYMYIQRVFFALNQGQNTRIAIMDERRELMARYPWQYNNELQDSQLLTKLKDAFEAMVKTLPIRESTPFNNETCSICSTNFKQHHTIRIIDSCQHSFHVLCVDEWFKRNPVCPLCRDEVVRADAPWQDAEYAPQRRDHQ